MNILVAAKYTDRFPRIKNYSTGVTIYIDTEQSGIEFWEMQRKLRFMWGEEGNQEDIMSYNLVPFPTLGDKRLAIKAALEICRDMNKDVSLLVIDGFKDLVGDSNDEKESKEVIEEIKLHTKQYYKEQLKWYKNEKRITWVKNFKEAKEEIKKYLTKISLNIK
jgi:hypothetical protein